VDPLPYSEEQIYQQLFDPNNQIKLDLQMSAAELQKLQDDYDHYRDFGSKSPIYRMGTLKITITTSAGTTIYRINEVGARMKGNTSRTDFYNSNDGIYKYIHLKLDFTETFDDKNHYGNSAKVWANEADRDARKDRTFATLEQLEMRWNKCYDPTYLRETYAYALYKSEGVIAPLANLCSFGWSGNHMGIYTIVEPVDKIFLEKRFVGDDADGDLYKCGYVTQPANLTNTGSIGIEDEDSGKFYSYDLKNNKKTSTHAALKNLINRLNSPTLTKDELAKLVDMDQFIAFAAVSYFLGNPDDIRNNSNNYYLYFVPSTGKAVFIPYDFDRCLGLTYEWDPSGNGVTQDDPFTDRMAINERQRNPLFNKTVVKGGWYVKEYSEALKKVAANTMMKSATFEQWFNRANSLYGSLVQPSKKFYNADGRDFRFSLAENLGGNMSVKTYLTKKLNTYNRAIGNLDDILDYQPPEQVIYYIRGGFNDWQDRPEYAMTIKDGKATITLTIRSNDNNQRFKIYNCVQQLWYGGESISPNTTVDYQSLGEHGNILLKAGKYKIELDLTTMLITITPA
jgi:spore coat protein CotH